MKVLTYLINLEGSHQRLEHAKQQLDDISWDFERVPAVDGRGQPLSSFIDYNDPLAKDNLGRSLLNAEIGCYLSHYRCVSKFLASDADYLIVLEDDMTISSDFSTVLQALLDYLYNTPSLDWYLINLAPKKKKLAKDIVQINHHSLWHAYYFPILGLGLLWSRKGAEQFLREGEKITMPVDVFFQRWLSKNGKGLAVWPALVEPNDMDSDIWSEAVKNSVSRIDLEDRDKTYSIKKQKRMWQDKTLAFKNKYLK